MPGMTAVTEETGSEIKEASKNHKSNQLTKATTNLEAD